MNVSLMRRAAIEFLCLLTVLTGAPLQALEDAGRLRQEAKPTEAQARPKVSGETKPNDHPLRGGGPRLSSSTKRSQNSNEAEAAGTAEAPETPSSEHRAQMHTAGIVASAVARDPIESSADHQRRWEHPGWRKQTRGWIAGPFRIPRAAFGRVGHWPQGSIAGR